MYGQRASTGSRASPFRRLPVGWRALAWPLGPSRDRSLARLPTGERESVPRGRRRDRRVRGRHGQTDPLGRGPTVLFGRVDGEVVATETAGDRGDRPGTSEHVDDPVPPVAVELHESLDQGLGERSRVALSSPLGRDLPEPIRELFELAGGDVDRARISLESPLALREDQNVFPRRHDVGVGWAPPAAPGGPTSHRLFVPNDLGAHDVAEVAQVAREVVVDRTEVLDRGRGDVQDEAAPRYEDPIERLPDAFEPAKILLGRKVVRVLPVGDPNVVRRARDGELDRGGREPVQYLSGIP